jgi:hypothetical protein
MEVVEALRPALRHRSGITAMRIKPVIDMSVKAVRAVKPRACAKKHSANKPIRPVVAVGRAVIGFIVEVSVRTHGSYSDVYANGNLSLRRGCTAQKASYENCKSKRTDFQHDFSLIRPEFQLGQLRGSIIPSISDGQSGISLTVVVNRPWRS